MMCLYPYINTMPHQLKLHTLQNLQFPLLIILSRPSSSSNPVGSQVIPPRIRKAIETTELAIQGAQQEAANKEEELRTLEASIAEKKKIIRELHKEVRAEQAKADQIRAFILEIESFVFERSGFISELKAIYPEDD